MVMSRILRRDFATFCLIACGLKVKFAFATQAIGWWTIDGFLLAIDQFYNKLSPSQQCR